MVGSDRREFQRLRLAKPILALMDGQSALILDIGVSGAFLEHYGEVASGKRFHLLFRWQGHDVEFVSEVARSTVVRSPGGDGRSLVSHTGVRFAESIGDSERHLQDMMATFVGRVLAAQKANASGENRGGIDGDATLAQLGEARRSRSRGYIRYQLQGKAWKRSITESPEQLDDGFTVAAFEDEEELETLCRAYEVGDEEARSLIRLVAELSVRGSKR